MNTSKDYYAILGVLPIAEDIVIHGAYRALAQRYHPDKSQDGGTRMAEINEAYRILSDETLRAQYDKNRQQPAFGAGFDPHTDFAVEQFRPFAEKLHEWGYSATTIRDVLAQRGASPTVAEQLAKMVTGGELPG